MRYSILTAFLAILCACNNSKKPEKTADIKTIRTDTTEEKVPDSKTGNVSVIVDDKTIQLNGSLLVSKDKDKLQPGADYLVVMTSSGGEDHASLTINFLMALKEGTYPVVGNSFVRGDNDNGEVYGSILGGKPKITEYKVTLTEVKDLGSNNLGGHKWRISGTVEPMTIKAMAIMLLDETKKHPKEVNIGKVTFTNLPFDDNWEEMMKKAMDQLKKAN